MKVKRCPLCVASTRAVGDAVMAGYLYGFCDAALAMTSQRMVRYCLRHDREITRMLLELDMKVRNT